MPGVYYPVSTDESVHQCHCGYRWEQVQSGQQQKEKLYSRQDEATHGATREEYRQSACIPSKQSISE
jgi:hypothetical protein